MCSFVYVGGPVECFMQVHSQVLRGVCFWEVVSMNVIRVFDDVVLSCYVYHLTFLWVEAH